MNITIYSRHSPPCPYCINAKSFLDSKGIPYKEVVIGRDVDREWVLENFPGRKSVPIILIDNFVVGGYDDLVEHYRVVSSSGTTLLNE
jgi:glutaredoxin